MAHGLDDFVTETSPTVVTASKLESGIDADKSASPTVGDVYVARDTKKIYFCHTAGTWTGFDASILVQGILTLYANLVGGGYKLTGIGAPTASDDAARKTEVDTVAALLDDVSLAQPTRAKDTEYQNSTKIRLVTVSVDADAGDAANLYVGSASPPNKIVSQIAMTTLQTVKVRATLVGIIPPSNYYKVTTMAGTIEVYQWTEWDLF